MNRFDVSRRHSLCIATLLVLAAWACLPASPAFGQDPPDPLPPRIEGRTPPKAGEELDELDPDEGADAQAFLVELSKLYDIPMEQGLESFEAVLRVRKSRDERLTRAMGSASVHYRWARGEKEKITVKGVADVFSKGIREPLMGFWWGRGGSRLLAGP